MHLNFECINLFFLNNFRSKKFLNNFLSKNILEQFFLIMPPDSSSNFIFLYGNNMRVSY
jgi:hypothetical protein